MDNFDDLCKDFFNTIISRSPIYASYLGLHEYDHLLPDESKESYLEKIEIMKKFLKKFEEFQGDLEPDKKIDRELAIHIIKLYLFYLEVYRKWESDPDAADIAGGSLFPLITRDFAPFEERLENIIKRLSKVSKLLEQVKTRITNPIKLWTEIAIESCDRIPVFFDEIIEATKLNKSEKTDILEELILETKEEIKKYKSYLKEKILPNSKEDCVIGKEKFDKLLELRELEINKEEILKLGEEFLKEGKEELIRLANIIDPSSTPEEVEKKIRSNHPKTFNEALECYRKSMEKARNFIIEKDIVTMPKDEELIVIETPPYMRHTTPFAAYFAPAKFDKKKLGIYIVTPSNDPQKLQKHCYYAISNTTVHEAYPGHHLQLSAATQNKSLIRTLCGATELVEGWAHYCEEYMKELGYDNTSECKFIQTIDIVWRATRIIIDIKLSSGEMSFDEAVDFLIEQTGMERESAVAEVKRYTQSPSYQLSYLLGKHLLKELKKDVRSKMGNKFTDKFFNDTLLYAGSIPLKYMKKIFEEKING